MESFKKTNFLTILCLVLLLTGQGTDAFLGKLIGGAIGVCAATVALPAALGVAGFTSAGIAAGSLGAAMMSASGGAVAAGSTVAVLQSVGAAGLSSGAIAAAGAAGAAVGSALDP